VYKYYKQQAYIFISEAVFLCFILTVFKQRERTTYDAIILTESQSMFNQSIDQSIKFIIVEESRTTA